ncbi:MAG: acyltransferase domain-containing protein, partial [Actinomycetota bacterium]|nr:acyltransferase domain-containing protein [Actinomycetota bacterium]
MLAVVRGSAVNQDGASNGLTAPSDLAQERVIRQALASCQLSSDQIDVVEAHGTGTTLGDPIEAQALLATYGRERPADRPLRLGSIKSNMGHAAAAAGVAGVIKMVQAMRHDVLPKTLHVDEPTPKVDWSGGAVSLLTESVPWPAGAQPRRAAVSSFGVSGTNAHLILEEAPAIEVAVPEAVDGDSVLAAPSLLADHLLLASAIPLLLSAKSQPALRAQAAKLLDYLQARPALLPAEVAATLALTRSGLDHRAVLVAGDRDDLLAGLAGLAAGEQGAVTGLRRTDPRPVFVFPGQGSQWVGMALGLLDNSAVFASSIAECERALTGYVDWSLTDVLRGTAGSPSLERVDVVQPVLWAVMVSLAAVWRSFGVQPAAVLGHSQGEIAAAVVAGGLSLQDGAKVVALRSLALLELAGQGGMVSLALPVAEVEQRLADWKLNLSIATVNGPAATVVSGAVTPLETLLELCEQHEVRAKRIPVDYASHSVQVETIHDRLLKDLAGIEPLSGDIPFYSTVTTELFDTAGLDPEYWYQNLRQTVRFHDTVQTLIQSGHDSFIETSPHPVLVPALSETESITAIGTLRRDEGGPTRLLTSLAQAHVQGIELDWRQLFQNTNADLLDLPTYAFQRERYWVSGTGKTGDVTAAGLGSTDHPLLGATVRLAHTDECLLTGRVSLKTHPWLADHAVTGTVLLPGAAFVELAIRAGDEVGCPVLEELTLYTPLVLPEQGNTQLQLMIGEPDESGRRAMTAYGRAEDAGDGWTEHASATLVPGGDAASRDAAGVELTSWPPAGAEPVDLTDYYENLEAAGYGYGPAFQGLRAAWTLNDDVYADIELPTDQQPDASHYGIHPALLDAALHASGLAGFVRDHGQVRLPFAWNGVRLHAAGASRLRVRLSAAENGQAEAGGEVSVALQLADQDGQPVASVRSLVMRPVTAGQLSAQPGWRDSLFQLDWSPLPATDSADSADDWPLLGSDALDLVTDRQAGEGYYPNLAALGSVIDAGLPVPELVVWTPPADDPADLAAGVRHATGQTLSLLQQWLGDPRFEDSRLVVLTSGAVSIRTGQPVTALAQAAVWGLLRSAQSENPGRFLLLDLDPNAVATPAAAVTGALTAAQAGDEPQLAVRDGAVLN